LIEDSDTTGYRMLNGESDGFPGLVADRYADTVVVKVYSEAWLPHLAVVLEELIAATGPDTVVIRTARSMDVPGLDDGTVVFDRGGTAAAGPDDVWFVEHGLRFLAHPRGGQKTGFFLDQRDNRQRIRERSHGKNVLDLFSCTGGFSVAAAVGGANHVTSVDMSPSAIETAERVMEANPGPSGPTPWEGIVGDAFDVMRRMKHEKRQFGVVVVDPPSFAQRQANIAGGLRAYGNLTQLALELVEPGGTLLQASCSSRITAEAFFDKIHETAAASPRRVVELERTGHAVDHPVTFPEGAYLKALIARVD
jgi:23S rRNA (cytosine1962-C5)-methyltransferase